MIRHSKYSRGNIYLSGSMEYAPDGKLGRSWRTECSEVLKSMEYFPLDIAELDIAYASNHGELYRSFGAEDEHLLQMKSNIRKHFVYTDLELIKKDSDAIILLYDEGVRKGAGTISEAQISYLHDIPIFIVNTFPDLSSIPGWLKALSTIIFNNFEELYEYLEKLPPKILCRDVYGNHNSGDYYLCSLCGKPFKKHKHHFVSKISPLYCGSCVEIVKTTFESHKDRYQFFVEYLTEQSEQEK